MKRGPFGLLVLLIVALLVAFLLMKQMQSPLPFSERVSQATMNTAVDAAQNAVDALNEAMQNTNMTEMLQDMLGGTK